MTERVRTFWALAKSLREQTEDQPQTPSHILIKEDRDCGHGFA